MLDCVIKDDDKCLQKSPGWSISYKCKTSTQYCNSWAKDMKRCCPDTCKSGEFTEVDCRLSKGLGTCIYPSVSQGCKSGLSNGSPEPTVGRSLEIFMLKHMKFK